MNRQGYVDSRQVYFFSGIAIFVPLLATVTVYIFLS